MNQSDMTNIGISMRQLYEQYGAQEVLTNEKYLINGLGDLARNDYTPRLRSQLSLAMDAGLGRLYLEQIKKGYPDTAFYYHVRDLLINSAGLNDKTAEEIIGYFDEMTGWAKTQSVKNIDRTRTDSDKKKTEYTEPKTVDVPQTHNINNKPEEKKKRTGLIIGLCAGIVAVAVFVIILISSNKSYSPDYSSSENKVSATGTNNNKLEPVVDNADEIISAKTDPAASSKSSDIDPVLNFYNTYLTGWNNLDFNFSMTPDSLHTIGSKLQDAGWMFINPENNSEYESVYTYFDDTRMNALYKTSDNAIRINMNYLYWGHGAQPWLEITADFKSNVTSASISDYRKAAKGFMPDAVIDLLGQKTADELGITDTYISSLKKKATTVNGDEFTISNYKSGIEYLDIYHKGSSHVMEITTDSWICRISWQSGEKINYLFIRPY